jgi:signal transduction histidine kinase
MPQSFRAPLLLLATSILVAGALVFGINRWRRSIANSAGRPAAYLLAREIGDLLADTGEALSGTDPVLRERMEERVQAIAQGSPLVSSLTLIDTTGHVVTGASKGSQAPAPSTVFGAGVPEIRLDPQGALPVEAGSGFTAFVPIRRDRAVVGYARLTLRVPRDAHVAALAGTGPTFVVLCLLAAGAIGLDVGRRLYGPAGRLKAAQQGPRLEPTPEISPMPSLSEAGRAMGERPTGAAGFNALAEVMKPGMLIVGNGWILEFINARAVGLLGAQDADELASFMTPLLDSVRSLPLEAQATLNLPGPAGLRPLRAEVHTIGPGEGTGYLILLNDPRAFETLEGDVRLASQWQGVARTYRTVVHELKAPLSAITIHLDLLRESLATPSESGGPPLVERQKRYVSILGEEVRRLNRTLVELLSESAAPNEVQEPFDLVELTRDLGTLLAPQARRQNVHLALRTTEESLTLVGYRDRLKQALLNITVNALEAMPGGGRVAIEVEADRDRARVKISDAGPGIAPELLSRIYESDFTTKGGGSGIGLYVAHALVQMHGGAIQVQSEPGQGTRVTVELPLVRPS